MRSEYLVIGLLAVLIVFAAVLLLAAVYVSSPKGLGNGINTEEATPAMLAVTTLATTLPSASTTTLAAVASGASSLGTTTTVLATTTTPDGGIPLRGSLRPGETWTSLYEGRSSTTTSTTLPLPKLTIDLPDETVYKNEDVTLRVLSDGLPVADATIILDGELKETTPENGRIVFYGLNGGSHSIGTSKDGYESASAVIAVRNISYAASGEVKIQHTPEERAQSISKGKVVLIFYNTPNCRNCIVMRQWVADIVNKNRKCVSYEFLILANSLDELQELLPDAARVSTPVIVIEGARGKYITSGYHSKTEIEEKLVELSSERCPIQ